MGWSEGVNVIIQRQGNLQMQPRRYATCAHGPPLTLKATAWQAGPWLQYKWDETSSSLPQLVAVPQD